MKVILPKLNELPDKDFRKYIGSKLSDKYLSTYQKLPQLISFVFLLEFLGFYKTPFIVRTL